MVMCQIRTSGRRMCFKTEALILKLVTFVSNRRHCFKMYSYLLRYLHFLSDILFVRDLMFISLQFSLKFCRAGKAISCCPRPISHARRSSTSCKFPTPLPVYYLLLQKTIKLCYSTTPDPFLICLAA